ncbi:MAG TPA: hypothetical protein VGD71_38995 [Kribbella sp.]|jgi:hypothetical protein
MAEAERFEPPDRFGTLAFKVGDGVTDEVRRRPCHSAEARELPEKLIREQVPAEQEKRKELIARVAEELQG